MPPFILGLLGAGLRLVANAALVKGKDFIKDKTGVDLDKAVLSQEDQLKLRQFELDHEEELLRLQLEDNRLGLEETKAYLADVADARKREVDIAISDKVPGYIKATPTVLAWDTVGITLLLFAFFVVISGDSGKTDAAGTAIPRINPTQKDIIVYILGVLSAVVTQIFSYYFGSSKSSESKNQTIDSALKSSMEANHQAGEAR